MLAIRELALILCGLRSFLSTWSLSSRTNYERASMIQVGVDELHVRFGTDHLPTMMDVTNDDVANDGQRMTDWRAGL